MLFSRKRAGNRGGKQFAERCASLFFCILLLLFSSCASSVGEIKPDEPVITSAGNVGRILYYGAYEQDGVAGNGPEMLRWKVIDERGDYLLLLSETALDCISYHESFEKVAWKDSAVYTYLNETVYENAFSPELREHIVPSENGRLFLFSKDEFCKYYASYRTDAGMEDGYERDSVPLRLEEGCPFSGAAYLKSALTAKEAPGPWMLRTDETTLFVKYVDSGWKILSDDITADFLGIRPLMWVKKEALSVAYRLEVELSPERKPLFSGDTLSLEPGEVFVISNNGRNPLDPGRLTGNAFPILHSGSNTFTAATGTLQCEFTFTAEPKAVSLASLHLLKYTMFPAGYMLTEQDLKNLFVAEIRMEDNTVRQVSTANAELVSGKTVQKDQGTLRFRYYGFEFDVPINFYHTN